MLRFLNLLVGISHAFTLSDGNFYLASDMSHACPHQYYSTAGTRSNISLNSYIERDIRENSTHYFYLENNSHLNSSKKILFRLEPCHGVMYLFIRKTRPCWPNPWTEEWTHFKSITDGTNDGGTTVFFLPSEVTRWFITVFAKSAGSYRLTTFQTDHLMFPVLENEVINAEQINRDTIQLRWYPARSDVTSEITYTVYASMYFETGELKNQNLLLSTSRIMNTACGLKRNTDHAYSLVTLCGFQECTTNISSLSIGRKYVFNVVATDSIYEMQTAYGGILVEAKWDDSIFNSMKGTLKIIGIVLGTTELSLAMAFFILYHKFG